MIVKTKLSEQAEKFELDGVHYVGRRVLMPHNVQVDAYGTHEIEWRDVTQEVRFSNCTWKDCVLLKLDYDRGDVFVDPAILKPYQRPEREEAGT